MPDRRRRKPLLRAIRRFFDTSPQRIFKRKELEAIVSEKRRQWQLSASKSIKELVTKVLLTRTDLREIRLAFPARTETRYIWKQATPFEMALSVRKNAYLSHFTAMHLHGLADNSSPNVYVNLEQSPKPESLDELSQASIDAAFKCHSRTTSQYAPYEKYVIHLLNGKHTAQLGVVHLAVGDTSVLPVTSIERTLVDAAVRPQYSGGISSVLRAYRRARGRLSVESLSSILTKLDYRYPYHQAIGFYLERSQAWSLDEIDIFRQMPITFDFYLDHRIDKKQFDEKWRIYYPASLLLTDQQ